MAPHLTHIGVHDHGFNNVSTYGALWRLAREGRIDASDWEMHFYELALKVSGAVQARRVDAAARRRLHPLVQRRALAVRRHDPLAARARARAPARPPALIEEQDAPVNLLERLLQHARATARYNVYYGNGRDSYDVRGRVAHESLFNVANGTYRGPSRQQGYSPFTTWTRGLAWAMLGFAEQLEFLATLPPTLGTSAGARVDAIDARGRARDVRLLHRPRGLRRRHSLLGHRRAGPRALGDWGSRPRIRSTIASRSTAPRPRSPRRGCCGSADCSRRAAKTARATRRPACACSTRCSTTPVRI